MMTELLKWCATGIHVSIYKYVAFISMLSFRSQRASYDSFALSVLKRDSQLIVYDELANLKNQ